MDLSPETTTTATYTFIDCILRAVIEKELVLGIFYDLSKAFDLVNHQILLKKLEHYGIRGNALQLLQSYLTNRKQAVEVTHNTEGEKTKHISKQMTIQHGVPKGSILGPLLFLLYINNLPTHRTREEKCSQGNVHSWFGQ